VQVGGLVVRGVGPEVLQAGAAAEVDRTLAAVLEVVALDGDMA